WLKSYLNFDEDRALWAYVADEVMAKKALASDLSVDEAIRRNMYLQSWRAKIVGKDSLNPDLKKMVQVADKYDVQMEALAVSREAQRSAIIWYHTKSNANGYMFNSNKVNDCLKHKHKVLTVGDAENLARKTQSIRHTYRRDCRCDSCAATRTTTACSHPNQCFAKSRAMLMSLPDKWNPLMAQPEDYEEMDEIQNNLDARQHNTDEEEILTFKTKISQATLTDTFRIFNDGIRSSGYAPDTRMEPEPDEEYIDVFTDGSATQNGPNGARAGAGIFFGENDVRNTKIKVPAELGVSNQVAELVAIKEA
ncbi:hypothetical protein R3P38DRAFT_2367500, partial [Favolaschia claudopus]